MLCCAVLCCAVLCYVCRLRDFISRCKESALPALSADTETHIAGALDASWSQCGGDWDALVATLKQEFFHEVCEYVCE